MGDCCNVRLLKVLVVFFGVTSLALAITVMVLALTRETNDTVTDYNSAVLTKKYPSLFRTATQQQFYQQQYISSFENRTAVTHTIVTNRTCTFKCLRQQQPAMRKRRDTSGYVHHGCCRSRVTFTSPRHSANYAGVNRTLVQFDDVRQYFGVHDCSAYTSCSGCVCLQENSLHTAVVWKHGETDPDDIEDTETDFFFFDGCCKCVNV